MKPLKIPLMLAAFIALGLAGCSTRGVDPDVCESLNPVIRGLDFNIDLEARGVSNNPAFPYVECLANNGVKFAQYWLGMFYLNGNGTPQNYNLAVKFLKRAAKTDPGIDTTRLQGQGGNLDFIQEHQVRPRQEGIGEAQFELAKLYLSGTGVKQSQGRAIQYLKEATAQGHPGAQELLAELTGGLNE